jgi:hypothetical protein
MQIEIAEDLQRHRTTVVGTAVKLRLPAQA